MMNVTSVRLWLGSICLVPKKSIYLYLCYEFGCYSDQRVIKSASSSYIINIHSGLR